MYSYLRKESPESASFFNMEKYSVLRLLKWTLLLKLEISHQVWKNPDFFFLNKGPGERSGVNQCLVEVTR